MRNIIIFGAPGSGKDTQIDEMAKYLPFQLISSGDIVRHLSEKNEKIRKIMDDGGLIDDTVLFGEIDKKLGTIDTGEGVIFDGFPRTLHQAEVLNELMLHHGRNIDVVIYLELDESEVVKRLSGRMVCSSCGHNIVPGATSCELCSGEPIRRHDDEPAVIIKRVQTFLENTLPLVNYYRNKGILLEINGDQPVEAVANDIKEKLGE